MRKKTGPKTDTDVCTWGGGTVKGDWHRGEAKTQLEVIPNARYTRDAQSKKVDL